MYSIARCRRDVDVAVADLDGEGRHRLGGGQAGRLTGTQVEAGAMQPALQRAAVDLTLAERDRGVTALVAYGVEVGVGGLPGGHLAAVALDADAAALVDAVGRPDPFENPDGYSASR